MTVFATHREVPTSRDDGRPPSPLLRKSFAGTTCTDLTADSLSEWEWDSLGSASARMNLGRGDCDDGLWGSVPSASRRPSLSQSKDFLRSKLHIIGGGRGAGREAPLEDECLEKEPVVVGGADSPKRERGEGPAPPGGAWLLYSYATRIEVMRANPKAPFQEISRIISTNFKALSPKERVVWDRRANEDKERCARELRELDVGEGGSTIEGRSKRGNRRSKKGGVAPGEATKRGGRARNIVTLETVPRRRRAHSVERLLAAKPHRRPAVEASAVSTMSSVRSANSKSKKMDQTLGELMRRKTAQRGPWYSSPTPAPAPPARVGRGRKPTRKGPSAAPSSKEGSIPSSANPRTGGGNRDVPREITKREKERRGPRPPSTAHDAPAPAPSKEVPARPGRRRGSHRGRSAERRRPGGTPPREDSYDKFLNFIGATRREGKGRARSPQGKIPARPGRREEREGRPRRSRSAARAREGAERGRDGEEGRPRRSKSAGRRHPADGSYESFEEFLNFIGSTYEERREAEREARGEKDPRGEGTAARRGREAAATAGPAKNGKTTTREAAAGRRRTAGGGAGRPGRRASAPDPPVGLARTRGDPPARREDGPTKKRGARRRVV